jgi:hypothetical protein
MSSKDKLLQTTPQDRGQLSLFEDIEEKLDSQSMSSISTTAKVLSFEKALKNRESIKIADVLRSVWYDVEHLKVK